MAAAAAAAGDNSASADGTAPSPSPSLDAAAIASLEAQKRAMASAQATASPAPGATQGDGTKPGYDGTCSPGRPRRECVRFSPDERPRCRSSTSNSCARAVRPIVVDVAASNGKTLSAPSAGAAPQRRDDAGNRASGGRPLLAERRGAQGRPEVAAPTRSRADATMVGRWPLHRFPTCSRRAMRRLRWSSCGRRAPRSHLNDSSGSPSSRLRPSSASTSRLVSSTTTRGCPTTSTSTPSTSARRSPGTT